MRDSLAEFGAVIVTNMAAEARAWEEAGYDAKRCEGAEDRLDKLGRIIRLLPRPDLAQTVVRLAAVAHVIEDWTKGLCARERERGEELAKELRAAIGELRQHVVAADDGAVEAVLE